jgi:hypothetical protein
VVVETASSTVRDVVESPRNVLADGERGGSEDRKAMRFQ